MRLVGASNRFIQTPFILEGVFAAFLGSVLASGAVIAGMHFGVEGYLKGRVPFITTWVSMQDALIVVPILIAIYGAVRLLKRRQLATKPYARLSAEVA